MNILIFHVIVGVNYVRMFPGVGTVRCGSPRAYRCSSWTRSGPSSSRARTCRGPDARHTWCPRGRARACSGCHRAPCRCHCPSQSRGSTSPASCLSPPWKHKQSVRAKSQATADCVCTYFAGAAAAAAAAPATTSNLSRYRAIHHKQSKAKADSLWPTDRRRPLWPPCANIRET